MNPRPNLYFLTNTNMSQLLYIDFDEMCVIAFASFPFH